MTIILPAERRCSPTSDGWSAPAWSGCAPRTAPRPAPGSSRRGRCSRSPRWAGWRGRSAGSATGGARSGGGTACCVRLAGGHRPDVPAVVLDHPGPGGLQRRGPTAGGRRHQRCGRPAHRPGAGRGARPRARTPARPASPLGSSPPHWSPRCCPSSRCCGTPRRASAGCWRWTPTSAPPDHHEPRVLASALVAVTSAAVTPRRSRAAPHRRGRPRAAAGAGAEALARVHRHPAPAGPAAAADGSPDARRGRGADRGAAAAGDGAGPRRAAADGRRGSGPAERRSRPAATERPSPRLTTLTTFSGYQTGSYMSGRGRSARDPRSGR